MNYDFKANWETVIMPLLRTQRMRRAMKQGITDFIEEANPCRHISNQLKYQLKYHTKWFPHDYSNFDDGQEYLDYEFIELPKHLIERGVLLEDENAPRREDYDNDDKYEYAYSYYHEVYNSKCEKYRKYSMNVCKPYVYIWFEKRYQSYCLYGGCHWWNPTFGLELAKMVMPCVKWIVKKGAVHTTVTTKEEDLVFDILMYEEKDEETLGGSFALSETCVKEAVVEVLKS